MKIKLLPQNVIIKTKAEQIIECPADVVKELIENALDAGAQDIKIVLAENGLRKIVVMDNGFGMTVDDLMESFKPHTTSKIYSEDDLVGIKTLGFRGEALASIAAVANVIIKSRTLDMEFGNVVEIATGKTETCAMQPGTSVEVTDLFFNTPARFKFLKNPKTEYKKILNLLTELALANPQVGFELLADGKKVLELPAVTHVDLVNRVAVLLGRDVAAHLFEVLWEEPHYKIYGLLGKPQIALANKEKQFLFVNGRSVSHGGLADKIKSVFGNLLEARAYPVFVLFLEMAHEMVDVNVHPKKTAIRFFNEPHVLDFVGTGMLLAIKKTDLTYVYTAGSTGDYLTTDVFGNRITADYGNAGMAENLARVLREGVDVWNVKDGTVAGGQILQVADLYLVFEDDGREHGAGPSSGGLCIVDQHAAHEKILFEQFLDEYKKKVADGASGIFGITMLAKPISFDTTMAESEMLRSSLKTFSDVGFEIEWFGGTTFRITGVWDLFKDLDLVRLVKETLAELANKDQVYAACATDFEGINKEVLKTINFLACRSAIKAGEKLTQDEMKNLLEKLAATRLPYTCPHGRPVKVVVSLSDLGRMFKRIK